MKPQMTNSKLMLTLGIATSLFLIACGDGGTGVDNTDGATTDDAVSTPAEETMTEFDLTEKGIPIVVVAPSGSEVEKGAMSGEMDGVKTYSWEIKKDNFKLEVSMWDDDNEDTIEELITGDRELSEGEDGFEIIKEEANGYIYKYTIEGDEDHNFYYVVIKDNRAIEFTTGLNFSGEYTLDEVEKLYEAAKNSK